MTQPAAAHPPDSGDPSPAAQRFLAGLAAVTRAKRGAAGLSQQTLARRAGVGPKLISAVENGRANPGLGVLIRLADALDLDGVGELVTLAEDDADRLANGVRSTK